MRNMYTHGGKPARRNLTVADLRAFKERGSFRRSQRIPKRKVPPQRLPESTSLASTVR